MVLNLCSNYTRVAAKVALGYYKVTRVNLFLKFAWTEYVYLIWKERNGKLFERLQNTRRI